MPALPDANAQAFETLSTLELCARIDALTAELHDALAQFRSERDTQETQALPVPYSPERRAA